MKDLIGIGEIRIEMTLETDSTMSQTFVTGDFAEVIQAVMERTNRVTIKQVDVLPVIGPIHRTAGFTG